MAVQTECTLRLPNSPGALSEVCRVLAHERVNILALALESGGVLRLVVDNSLRATGALRDRRHQVSTREVIVVPASHAPGGIAPVLRLVSDAGVNVEYAYGAAAEGSPRATVVLGVDDPVRAATAAGV